MKTTKFIALCIVMLMAKSILAQSNSLKQGEHHFANKEFAKAIVIFESQQKRTEKLLKDLADSYFYSGKFSNAYKTYAELSRRFELEDEYLLRYANTAKSLERYALADSLLTKLTGQNINVNATIKADMVKIPVNYDISVLKNKDGGGEFGSVPYKNGIAFASTRNTKSPIYAWNQQPYLDLYTASIEDGTMVNITPLPGEINTDVHESNPSFTADGNTMYFTRNVTTPAQISGDKIYVINIFKAQLINGEWQNVESLPFNGERFSTAHPAISADGSKLYFSSDMPGGYGSYDIYEVSINADGTYGNPINLGEKVNTAQREQFPFVSKAGNLYFASTRINSLGGLDIYTSKRNGETFEEAINMGTTINTSADDFALVIDEDAVKGYLSSNRLGVDRIFEFSKMSFLVIGKVIDAENDLVLPNAQVNIYDAQGNEVDNLVTDNAGKYSFTANIGSYNIEANMPEYTSKEVTINLNIDSKKRQDVSLALAKINPEPPKIAPELKEIYFDFDDAKLRVDMNERLDELVDILKEFPGDIRISGYTDQRGSAEYNSKLSKRRAEAVKRFLIEQGINASRIEIKIGGSTNLVADCEDCSEEQFQLNRRTEVDFVRD